MNNKQPNLLPVMMARVTHCTVIHLTRVPCVGEIIYIPPATDGTSDGSNWRVTCVQHILPIEGTSTPDVVAEIHCVEVKILEDFDPWAGQPPSQQP